MLTTKAGASAGWTGPLFVIGMPRSGTKLLRGLLLQHPRIRIPDIETDFFPFLVRWVERQGSPQSEADFARLFESLSSGFYAQLRAREILQIEALAFDMGYRPVYATRQKQLSAIEQRVLRIKDGVRLVVGGARKRGLMQSFRFHLTHTRLAG